MPAINGDAVLELRDVQKTFGSTAAVDGITLSVSPGEVFTLLGPSGCGKSTTLRIVAGLEELDAGEVLLGGRLIASGARGFSLPPERRDLGMVFQSYAIWPHMTVFENVAFPLKLRGVPKNVTQSRVEHVLDLVGLSGLGSRGATDLSGGQQQRVALARAIVYEPKLLLLDEPLSNLDAKLREHMRIELRALQQRLGIAVLFVTHDQAEAMVLSDRIAVMQSGRLEQVGTPVALYERPASPFVRDFLGRVLTLEVCLRSAERAEAPGEAGVVFQLPPGCSRAVDGTSKLVLAWRPENVSIEPDSAPGLNRLSAIIESAAYLGERIEYGVRTAGGRSMLVVSTRQNRYEPGAMVGLRVDTSEATLWPGE
ncbi:MAG: ABC transporter ATP-binding protein [Chloroflexi bacterium]|nr:ABC transporter ATP-binding protein [Chloroflexota bacterium]